MRRTGAIFAFLLVFIGLGLADSCSGYGDCDDCVDHMPCGWCEDYETCHEGDRSGADDGTCSDPDWAWVRSECGAETCTQYTTCLECTPIAICGWCSNLNSCYEGTYYGPDNDACSSASWDWYVSDCSTGTCSQYDSCSDCVAHATCGWCTTGGGCRGGTRTGSTDGQCSDPNWAWVSSECGGRPGQCGTGSTDVGGVCMNNQCNANTAGGIISAIAGKAGEELDDIAEKTTDSSVDIATNIVSGIIMQGVADRLVGLDSLKGLKNTGGSSMIARAKRLMGNAVDRGLRFVIRKASQFGVSEQIANQAMSSAFEKLQQRVASVATSTSVGGLSTALKPAIRDYVVEPVIGTDTYKSEISSLSPSITCAPSYSPNMFSSKFQSMNGRAQTVESTGNTLEMIFTSSWFESAAQFISTNPMILTATGGSAASVYPTWKSAQLVSVAGVVVMGMYESYGVKNDALDCYELMGGRR